jgi:hypothetical protein
LHHPDTVEGSQPEASLVVAVVVGWCCVWLEGHIHHGGGCVEVVDCVGAFKPSVQWQAASGRPYSCRWQQSLTEAQMLCAFVAHVGCGIQPCLVVALTGVDPGLCVAVECAHQQQMVTGGPWLLGQHRAACMHASTCLLTAGHRCGYTHCCVYA